MIPTAIGAVILAAVLAAAGWIIKLLIDIRSNLSLIQYQVRELQDNAVNVRKALDVEALKVRTTLEKEKTDRQR